MAEIPASWGETKLGKTDVRPDGTRAFPVPREAPSAPAKSKRDAWLMLVAGAVLLVVLVALTYL